MSKQKLLFREIMFVITIKLLLLYGLWMLCFSHPLDKSLTSQAVSQHLITNNVEDFNHD